jgi:hypothetical protein
MAANQDDSARLWINVGAVDVSSPAGREDQSRLYLNVGAATAFRQVQVQPVGWGLVVEPSTVSQPPTPDDEVRLYVNIT